MSSLREEAADCRACPLYKDATQTVFGEGPQTARIMLVGEQPGDKEDLAGKPFVGPAGQMLDRALEEAGIDRRTVYVTNAVKHFKFVPRGKIRLHQKPNTPEIKACRPWYERELAAIKPELVVAMGATAAQSVFGKITPINKNRGRLIDLNDGTRALVTVHPSYLLRLPDADAKAREYQRFVQDLKMAADLLRKSALRPEAPPIRQPQFLVKYNAEIDNRILQPLIDGVHNRILKGMWDVWSRHDAPIWSTRCAVPLQPRRRAARDPLFRREAARMRRRRASARPHVTEITQLPSEQLTSLSRDGAAQSHGAPRQSPNDSKRKCPTPRHMPAPAHVASSDPAGRANRCSVI